MPENGVFWADQRGYVREDLVAFYGIRVMGAVFGAQKGMRGGMERVGIRWRITPPIYNKIHEIHLVGIDSKKAAISSGAGSCEGGVLNQ